MNRGLLAAVALSSAAPLVAVACDGGQAAPRSLDEPIVVRKGQFFPGDLPGSPPPTAGTGDAGAAPAPTGIAVTAVNLASQFVVPGGDKVISGRATGQPSSIGVRFADLGTGYWVVPIQEPDPNFPGQLTFSFNADFNAGNPAGAHPLEFTAFDGQGNAGLQFSAPLCVLGRIPDNLHECDPTAPVPAVVFSLRWDADFDLDLHVVTPDGRDINPKNPIGATVEAGARPPADAPAIDRDSLRACVPDGLRQEDLVMPGAPPVGPYDLFVDGFDSCGKPAVRFTLTIYEAGADGELHATFAKDGEMLGSQATGGASTGLFVFEKQFN